MAIVLGHAAVAEEASTYLVGGGGFVTIAGGADAAAQRNSGWTLYGGIRRRITGRISIGISGRYASAKLNPREFFDARGVFLNEPERHVTGGDFSAVGASVDGLYEHRVDKSTVLYGTLGAGLHQWSVDDIFTNAKELGIEDRVPPMIHFETESGFAAQVAAGVRFPLGDSAGLWAELAVELVTGASGGSMQLIPLRAGISLP